MLLEQICTPENVRGLTEQKFRCCPHHRKNCVGRISLVTSINSDLEFLTHWHLQNTDSAVQIEGEERTRIRNMNAELLQPGNLTGHLCSQDTGQNLVSQQGALKTVFLVLRKKLNTNLCLCHKSQGLWSQTVEGLIPMHFGKLPNLSSPWFHICSVGTANTLQGCCDD